MPETPTLTERRRHDRRHRRWHCRLRGWSALLLHVACDSRLPAASLRRLLKAQRLAIRLERGETGRSLLGRSALRRLRRGCSRGGWIHAVLAAPPEIASVGPKTLEDDDGFRLLRDGAIVLKAPSEAPSDGPAGVEKGVLVLAHDRVFRFSRECVDVAKLLERFTLVLAPGWSALANPDLLYFTRFHDHAMVVWATDHADHAFLRDLGSNLLPCRFGMSDWVDPGRFRPLPDEPKLYDAVLVARWAVFKRHHALFRAIRRIGDPSYRAALVGLGSDRARRQAGELAGAFGIASQIEILPRLPQEEVNRILNRSKVNVLLSLQEGSNRTLFEGLFAGVPALALSENVGLNRSYFTPRTGRLVAERTLSRELEWFRSNWAGFDPRPWALDNISAPRTTRKLDGILRRLAARRKEPWTRSIVGMCMRPELEHYPDPSIAKGLPTASNVLADHARSAAIREAILAAEARLLPG